MQISAYADKPHNLERFVIKLIKVLLSFKFKLVRCGRRNRGVLKMLFCVLMTLLSVNRQELLIFMKIYFNGNIAIVVGFCKTTFDYLLMHKYTKT